MVIMACPKPFPLRTCFPLLQFFQANLPAIRLHLLSSFGNFELAEFRLIPFRLFIIFGVDVQNWRSHGKVHTMNQEATIIALCPLRVIALYRPLFLIKKLANAFTSSILLKMSVTVHVGSAAVFAEENQLNLVGYHLVMTFAMISFR